jgi:DNA-binding response OmpR family regulator
MNNMNSMNKPLILCVEDNKKVQMFNKLQFAEHGYDVTLAFTLGEAREAIRREMPELIILDINMPDGDGRNFLRELRAGDTAVSKTPVLMLTGYGKDKDIVAGFESGCNDYMSKPYTFPVLFMRVKELLSRTGRIPDILQKGSLKLDVVSGQAFCINADLLLTKKEFALLLLFIQNENKPMSAKYLYEKVWKQPLADDKNALQVLVSRLRKKIEPSEYDISAERGKGYVLEKR